MIEYRVLGRTGARVSPLCLGTDNFADPTAEDECVRILDMAMDAGINLLDTGDVYAEGEGERIIGRALKRSGRPIPVPRARTARMRIFRVTAGF